MIALEVMTLGSELVSKSSLESTQLMLQSCKVQNHNYVAGSHSFWKCQTFSLLFTINIIMEMTCKDLSNTGLGNLLFNFQNKHFLNCKRSCYVTDNPLIGCFRKINII